MNIFGASREKIVAVFDVGSGSVGASLIELSDEAPRMLYSTRKEIPFQGDLNLERFVQLMIATVADVATIIEKDGLPQIAPIVKQGWRPASAFCVISAPWYASQIRYIHAAKEKPFAVTRKHINQIVAAETEAFKAGVLKGYAEQGLEGEEVGVIESTTIGVKLNGYPTNTPFDKEAQNLELMMYICMSPKQITDAIVEKIELINKIKNIEIHSFSLAFYDAVRDLNPLIDNFLLMDIGGEITEISLVRDGLLCETASFPFGKNFIVRGLSARFKTNAAEVISRIALATSEHQDAAVAQKFIEDCKDLESEWVEHLHKAAGVLAGGLLIPPVVFMAADNDITGWFRGVLARQPADSLYTHRAFEVHPIDAQFFKNGIVIPNKNTSIDPFLVINTLFSHKLLSKR